LFCPARATKDQLVAEIALLYYLAGQNNQDVILEAKLSPRTRIPTDSTIRVIRRGARAKEAIPFHGLVTLKIQARIDDSERSANLRILWNRISFTVRTDGGPFQETGRVITTVRVWFGLRSGKEVPLKKSQIPLLMTSVGDGGKYAGGGIWNSAPADGKSFWVTKGWTKKVVPEGRWKER
jgi:hypothetical protein